AAVRRAVPALEADQQRQREDLENVREIGRVLTGEELLQVLEEQLARHVHAEDFFLQRAAGPGGEHRLSGVPYRLVEQRDDREERVACILGGVALRSRILLGLGQHLLDAYTKRLGIGGDLFVLAKACDRRQRFLQRQRETAASRRGFGRHVRRARVRVTL